jgi:hypothetical protein
MDVADLKKRLAVLEHQRGPTEPTLIIIRGGLDASEPRETTIAGEMLECRENEPIAAFHRRCLATGKAAGMAHVILGGLPDLGGDGSENIHYRG